MDIERLEEKYSGVVAEFNYLEGELEKWRAKTAPSSWPSFQPKNLYAVDPTSELAVKIADLCLRYENSLNRIIDMIEEFEQAIEHLEPSERVMLRLGYLNGMPWADVADKIGVSRSHIYQLRAKAIEKVAGESGRI